MNKRAAFAAFNLALAVTLGALAAHYLKSKLEPQSLASFQTGVRYHIYHGLALLALALWDKNKLKTPWILMAIGMLCFSVSIYLLSTRGLLLASGSNTWLGPVTPVGGLLMISAWIWMGCSFLKKS